MCWGQHNRQKKKEQITVSSILKLTLLLTAAGDINETKQQNHVLKIINQYKQQQETIRDRERERENLNFQERTHKK